MVLKQEIKFEKMDRQNIEKRLKQQIAELEK